MRSTRTMLAHLGIVTGMSRYSFPYPIIASWGDQGLGRGACMYIVHVYGSACRATVEGSWGS